MPVIQAREMAKKQNLDLVEVAPSSVPPVCRLMDYGKYKYEQQKKEQQTRKTQKTSLLREVRLRPKIGIHDFEAKARTARKLLNDEPPPITAESVLLQMKVIDAASKSNETGQSVSVS